jgi:hypothetical protein
MNNVLVKINSHVRDADIIFEEVGHQYTIYGQKGYTSVTTRNHGYFQEFDAKKAVKSMMSGKNWKLGHKDWGKTAQQIMYDWSENGKKESKLGTQLHEKIELFMNRPWMLYPYNQGQLLEEYEKWNAFLSEELNKVKGDELILSETMENCYFIEFYDISFTVEWGYFLDFLRDYPLLVPYRTEWLVFHEEQKLAGSIDMTYIDLDTGDLLIYDWKRAKHIPPGTEVCFGKYATHPLLSHLPDTNFWHYALQLNTYRAILEKKYGKTVRELCLIRLHPNHGSYERIPLPDLQETIDVLFAETQNKK